MKREGGLPKELMEMLGSAGDGNTSDRWSDDAPDCESSIVKKVPVFRLDREDGALKLVVEVPGLTSMKGVDLDVAERHASLTFPPDSGLEPLRAELPETVVPTAARAKFSKKTKSLAVTLPL